ncbi:leucyl-tRNA synthetase [Botrytis cinerea]
MAAVEATAKALENATISKTKELKGTEKRDKLIAIERKYQAQWEKDGVFQPDAPSTSDIPLHSVSAAELREQHPKFFGTMAYPYMNGTLHAGHSFTVSKIEFTAGFARMQGKKTLFPMGFHLTGLPIKAAADKLVKEIKLFGKNFENYKEEEVSEEKTNTPTPTTHHEDVTKFTAKKGKAAAKVVKMKYQFQIMGH